MSRTFWFPNTRQHHLSQKLVQLKLEQLERREMPHGALTELAPAAAEPQPVDRVETRIINGEETTGFPSVGLVGDRRGFYCSGTLIAPRYVLTAGHCADGLSATGGRFRVGGVTYSTSRVFVHPNYNRFAIGTDNANDIAIFELATAVSGITPSPIFRGIPQVGNMLTLVGFGAGGTGSTGHDGTFGTKRVGTTPIDGVTRTLITWNFDNETESNTAPGDSGGPAFLVVNGEYQVAGVTSGGDRADAGLGDHSFDTRVDAYAAWIDGITGGGGGGGADDHGNTRQTATVVTLDASGNGRATGTINNSTDLDYFKIVTTKSGYLTIRVNALGGGLDPMVKVFNSSGRLVAQNDDYGGSLNSRVQIKVSAGKTYYIEAKGFGGSTGDYEVTFATTTGKTTSSRSAQPTPILAAVSLEPSRNDLPAIGWSIPVGTKRR
jgi:hypothetical protein